MSQIEFDESIAEALEVVYRTRDIRRRRALAAQALDAQPGDRVLDVGCGPGFYVAELLDQLGSSGSAVGVDTSPQMLEVARRRCAGRPNVSFEQGDATSLPVDDAAFDRALCVQVLEYVADVPAALAELHRALRPGGRVVVWDVDWSTVSWQSSRPERMERVLRAWDGHLTHPSLPRTLASQLRAAGFEDVAVEAHAFATSDFTTEAYGVASIPLVERYVAAREEVGEAEASAWAAEQRELGERGEFFFACMQFCFHGHASGSRVS